MRQEPGTKQSQGEKVVAEIRDEISTTDVTATEIKIIEVKNKKVTLKNWTVRGTIKSETRIGPWLYPKL
ncbi:hypothetical protein [Phaeobacter sp. 22II1-1F12B]|uniref:hypothetical protein n=1 Tax=Phaeobacter sp. 22II1-1F12B TaxID=1317111 RepID=UPI000B528041|nr:hypothetical protein [Phaeobacter sp. 22II1-1F12B]OWU79180.1 hypothetical protein ATO1_10580 [Phaeobacter sp. 22II1-1F12B]